MPAVNSSRKKINKKTLTKLINTHDNRKSESFML